MDAPPGDASDDSFRAGSGDRFGDASGAGFGSGPGIPADLLAALSGPAEGLRAAFDQGGAADTLGPGPVLAAVTEQAAGDLAALSDDELTGVLQAARRLENRAFYLQVTAVAEFARRREAQLEAARARKVPRGCRPGEYPDLELAAELLIGRRHAQALIGQSAELAARLPRTLAGMGEGRIDPARGLAVAAATLCLSDADAATVDEALAAGAHEVRADTVARRAAALAMKLDPEAVRREREAARSTRQRVQAGREMSGNAFLSGREMDIAEVMAAKANLDAVAVRLRNAGLDGTLDALRTRAFLDLLQFRNPFDRLAPAPVPPAADDEDWPDRGDPDRGDPDRGDPDRGDPDRGDPDRGDPGPGDPDGDWPGPRDGDSRGEESRAGQGTGLGHFEARAAEPDEPDEPDERDGEDEPDGEDEGGARYPRVPRDENEEDQDEGGARYPRVPRDENEEDQDEGGARYPSGPGTPAGGLAPLPALINLIVPASSLLGQGTAPGQAGGWGLTDPEETRDIVRSASQHPRTRWCVTAVNDKGEAVAHACARGRHSWTPGHPTDPRPPPDPQPPPAPHGTRLHGLLASLGLTPGSFAPIEKGACGHRNAEDRYTPSRKLKHLIRARGQTCTAPGCGGQAYHADQDHVTPYPDGPTCECNLHAPCRAHHRAKQAPGWHVEEPEPGVLRWTLPNGRTHTTRPTIYDY